VSEREDWPGLPADAELVSLWAPLHDASLVEVKVHFESQAATLVVESSHLNRHHGFGEQYRFRIVLEGVSDLSARGRDCADTSGVLRERDHNEVTDADLTHIGAGVMLRFSALLKDGTDYTELFATAERAHVVGSDEFCLYQRTKTADHRR
jgi:hypothetical protein